MTLKSNLLIWGSAVLFWGALSTRVSSHATPRQVVAAATTMQPAATYAGSQSCRRCHTATYERWSKTRMANVVTDPKAHPEVVLPDFSKPDPVLTCRRPWSIPRTCSVWYAICDSRFELVHGSILDHSRRSRRSTLSSAS
jgi:hypothetical protein